MQFLVRSSVLLLIVASLFFVGCGSGGGGGAPISANGEILLSAKIKAPTGTSFAASLRGAIAGVAASARTVSSRFKAVIKIDSEKVVETELKLDDEDNEVLIMEETPVFAPIGKRQVTIEVVAAEGAEEKPILKTILTAEVSAGEPVSKKDTPVTVETTAKAVAYDAWEHKSTVTIDEFEPVAADLASLQTIIATTLTETKEDGKKIIDSKDLTDLAITTKAEEIAKTAPVPTPDPTPDPTPAPAQRFSGDYRFFSYGAHASARWLTVSNITVNGTSLTWEDVLDPSNDSLESFSGTIGESDGLINIDNEHRAVVSPSGNYVAIHNFSADPYVGIGVKLPTNATNALLNGDYRIYCINETVDNGGGNPRSPKFTIDVVHFDGAGNGVGVGQILNEEGGGPAAILGEFCES